MQSHLDDFGKLLLRIALGGCMLFHGVEKIEHFAKNMADIQGWLESAGLPEVLKYGVLVGEVVVPALLILGILTRVSGFILAVNMVMAIYLRHQDHIMKITEHGGWAIEVPVLYLLGGLALALMGGGRLGVWRKGGILG